MANNIVQLAVSQQISPTPATLQKSGAIISQGATTTSQFTASLLTQLSDLTPLLSGSQAITSASATSSLITFTTTAPHLLPVADTFYVTTAGFLPAGYNGTWLATATGASTFTVPVPANPGSTTQIGAYTLEDVAELLATATTFFSQGSNQGIFVLELGEGSVNDGVASLTTYLTANPNSAYTAGATGYFYDYIVPRTWDANANFLSMLASYEAPTAKTYFHVTTTLATYEAYSPLMKCVKLFIESPSLAVYPANALTAISAVAGGPLGFIVTATTITPHLVSVGNWFQITGCSSGVVAQAATAPFTQYGSSNFSAASSASVVFTQTASNNFLAGDTITLGNDTYKFVSTLGSTPGNVLIGANFAASAANFVAAINNTGGAGAIYVLPSIIPNIVSAETSLSVITFTAIVPGTSGNAFASSYLPSGTAAGTIGASTFSGGVNGDTITVGNNTYRFVNAVGTLAGNVLIGANFAASAANLVAAINNTGGAGTIYVLPPIIPNIRAIYSFGIITFISLLTGTSGNGFTSTYSQAGTTAGTFGSSTFSGGVTGTYFSTAYNGWAQAQMGTAGSALVWYLAVSPGVDTTLGTLVASYYANTAVPALEFSAASDAQVNLNRSPSNTNKVTPNAFAFVYGVTPFPTRGMSALISTLTNAGGANVNIIGTGAEGGISSTIIVPGTTLDGNDFQYWYSVDWVQINADLSLANAVINGSNNPINPLYYNQAGIDRLQAVLTQVMTNGVTFGMVLGQVVQTQLDGPTLAANIAAGMYTGMTVVNAVPFLAYSIANTGHYKIGLYQGLSVYYVPSRGFRNILVNLVVSSFVAQ